MSELMRSSKPTSNGETLNWGHNRVRDTAKSFSRLNQDFSTDGRATSRFLFLSFMTWYRMNRRRRPSGLMLFLSVATIKGSHDDHAKDWAVFPLWLVCGIWFSAVIWAVAMATCWCLQLESLLKWDQMKSSEGPGWSGPMPRKRLLSRLGLVRLYLANKTRKAAAGDP